MSFPFSRTVGAGIHIVALSDVNILCDTSSGAVNLILPKITDAINFSEKQGNGIGGFGSGNFTLNIVDISNNASVNNITIIKNAQDTFSNNLSSLIINTNSGSLSIKPINTNLWYINESLSSGGGGGGGGVVVLGAGCGSSVRCGNSNTASGFYSTVLGLSNTATADYSTISGGRCNVVAGKEYGSIGGGFGNNISQSFATIGGGRENCSSGGQSTVGGGGFNCASGASSMIGGGQYNCATSLYSSVSGGNGNTASGGYSTVGGGYFNTASGYYGATVGGGNNNSASGCYSTVGGGRQNTASAHFSSVSGGYANTASGYSSFVGGGVNNIVTGNASAILGGSLNNTNSFNCAMIIGDSITANRANTTFVSKLSVISLDECATVGSLPSGSIYYDSATCLVLYKP